MYILGIETSCDETAAAILKGDPVSDIPPKLISNVVVSQIDIFKEYGGVIPEVAARSHLEAMLPVVKKAIIDAEEADPEFKQKNQSIGDKSKQQPLEEPRPSEQTPNQQSPSFVAIDAIAVTHTPGLLGSLLIGTLTARTLAILHKKPLYAVHHLKSHIYTNWLKTADQKNEPATELTASTKNQNPATRIQTPSFPLLAMVISGGHTQIIRMTEHNNFEIIGTTRDDAIGECFDKVAKIIGLPYPGGPSISNAALGILPKQTEQQDQSNNLITPNSESTPGDRKKYHFPHPRLTSPARPGNNTTKNESLDFSFSGLKTAVLREAQAAIEKPISFPSHEIAPLLSQEQVKDFAASFEKTAVDIILEKLDLALEQYPDTKSICFAGGVSANQYLRQTATNHFKNIDIFFPERSLSGDNGAMVGAAAFYEIKSGVKPTDPYALNIAPRTPIE